MSVTPMNRRERRSWSKLVREERGKLVPVIVREATDDGPEESFEVGIPDTDSLNELYRQRHSGDIYAALAALFGNGDNDLGTVRVDRLREVAKQEAGKDGRVPITVWRSLMEDTMEDLGLLTKDDRTGERSPGR